MSEIFRATDVFPPYNFDKYEAGWAEEAEHIHQKLYHVTGWEEVKDLQPGDALTLTPGEHHAQGDGVYFSEDVPRVEAADHLVQNRKEPEAIIEVVATDTAGWYRSKPELVKKYGKPRTWHSEGKEMRLVVMTKNQVEIGDVVVPVIHCAYRWIQEDEEKQPDLVRTLT
jgi:hypothetical protein